MNRCLFCYGRLESGQADFHVACSRKIFGDPVPPEVPWSDTDIPGLALEFIRRSISVTGVQPKLSVELTRGIAPKKITIVGLWGSYILKPPSTAYPNLPENEDLVMHLAELCGLSTVPHSLIRLKNGRLAYITKRVDRTASGKIHMEDMCQLTGRLTEHKYSGSHEQVAKSILKYSIDPILDVIGFYERTLFSFLTGNADMHLKNFSLINTPGAGYQLAPAYDLISTAIANPEDKEELALNLNGKKNNIRITDFERAMKQGGIDPTSISRIFKKFNDRHIPFMVKFIDESFLPEAQIAALKDLLLTRSAKLFQ